MSQQLHILGVCGTFMAGLALLARERGLTVVGSDANPYPPMSTQLAAAGIEVLPGYRAEHLRREPRPDLVLVGNAMSRGNPAVEALLNSTLAYCSGPQWLAEQVLSGRWTLAVAGTHGKTTTAAMLAWILERAGLKPGFLIGGVPRNFGVSARFGEEALFVVEADEYDSAFFDKRSKFIHYRPRTLILNNLEFDHADIFPDLAAIQRQFQHLVRTVPGNGLIIHNAASEPLTSVLEQGCWTPLQRFNDAAEWRAELLAADGSRFEVFYQGRSLGRVSWSQLGSHNVDNAVAALAAAHHAGVPVSEGLQALAEFVGVKRRLELRGSAAGVAVYDDFAHHPGAVAATVDGLRAALLREAAEHPDTPRGRLIALLELRSNTMRSGVFDAELPAALAGADRALVCAGGARQGSLLAADGVTLCADADVALATTLRLVRPGDRVLIMSNGGFGAIHERLLRALAEREAANP